MRLGKLLAVAAVGLPLVACSSGTVADLNVKEWVGQNGDHLVRA